MEIEDIKVSDEEIQEETEAQAEVKEDEIREKVVADLGIEDNDDNNDLIDKLVAREIDNRSRLSKAVGQKIKYRDLASGKKTDTKKPGTKVTTNDPVEAARLAAREEMMQRDLDDMSYSDEIKNEIKDLAERKSISVRQAEKLPYVQHLIAESEQQKKVDDAAKNGKNRTHSATTIDVSKPLDPAQFNLSTEEGRAEWEEAKKAKREASK